MTDYTSRARGKVMTRSELKASNDQLRRWNAVYREQIAALQAALQSIVDTAPVNGEDCSYVLAKSALAD
jgi:hypothetical protein